MVTGLAQPATGVLLMLAESRQMGIAQRAHAARSRRVVDALIHDGAQRCFDAAQRGRLAQPEE
jgi:hypothetical protein